RAASSNRPAPTADPDPSFPSRFSRKRSRLWLQSAGRGARETWSGVRRVLALVWATSRLLTSGLAGTSLLQSVLPAVQVWLAGRLIDEVVNGFRSGGDDAHIRGVVILALIQLAILVTSSLMQALSNTCQQLLQERLSIHVQLEIMTHANHLDLADFEDATYYDQLQQAQNESSRRPVQMVSQVFGLMQSIITFSTMVALLTSLSWWIAAAALIAPIPAFISQSRYGWWGFQVMRRQSPLRRSMSYLTTLMTTDQYAKEVKLFTLGDYFINRYRRVSDEYYEGIRTILVRRYLASFGWGSITTMASSGTFLYVAILAIRGQITLGALTVFTQAASQVQGAFQGILGGFQGIYENGLYLSTYYELLDKEPQISAPATPAPIRHPFRQGVEFRDVSYQYPGREEYALRNLSFTIDPGETVALVGRNGAGKSTIVKLLGRLYDPTEGQILIDGRDIREYDPAELRHEFGVMFQDYAAYQFSAAENIGVGNIDRMDDLAQVMDAADRAGASEVISKLPEGFQTTLGKWFEGGHQLSGGEWQKVALARAFMRNAQILILDEPTAALDARAEYELFSRIKELTTGRMALYISHRFSTARMADRIFLLEHGQLQEEGTHDELMLLDGQYAELFELQAASYR
ncbi:MAG: ABC transporter ATP-binding protein, partial [Thermomicrobiales bacterium]